MLWPAVVVMMALVGYGRAEAQTLDDAAVSAALQAGVSKKYSGLTSSCSAGVGFGAGLGASMAGGIQPVGSFMVMTSTAPGRIAFLASDAKRLYKSFTLADVTPEMRDASTVFVMIEPEKPARRQDTYEVPSPIEHVVLKSKTDGSRVAQPKDVQLSPREWSNLMGGKIEGNAAVATFALADVRELPAGDIDVVVITQAGERRCKINAKDRARVLEPMSSTSQQR
jgi:hypothetical protein